MCASPARSIRSDRPETAAILLSQYVEATAATDNAVFQKLGLHAGPDEHRRVRAVLAPLQARRT